MTATAAATSRLEVVQGDALAARLTALAAGLDRGGAQHDPQAAASARRVVERAGERLQLSTAHTVVALAGATGSGKSSLFNALAGLELARTGVRRPTTDDAQACVWGGDDAGPLLDWLGIPARHVFARESLLDAGRHDELSGLVLLDLPDHDSTALSHQLVVDRLVDLVDLLVWVVDPQKYADAALHEQYLRPLAAHEEVMLVVLNQVDRLDAGARRQCLGDLEQLLRADGLSAPRVLPTSTTTGAGVDELRAEVARAVRGRAARVARLGSDLDRAAAPLLAGLGGPPGEVHRRDRAALVEALAASAGVPAVTAAVAASVRHRAVIATGWPVTRWARRLRPDPLRRFGLGNVNEPRRTSLPVAPESARAQVDLAVRGVADAAAGEMAPSWVDAVRAAARGGSGDLAAALDRAVARTRLGADRRAWWWPLAGALQWLLLAVAAVGLGWLVLLGANGWLRLPDPATPRWFGLPAPTLLLIVGVGGGLLLALVGRLLAGAAAKRAAARARRRLRAAVLEVAEADVLAPVEAEVARWKAVRGDLRRAAPPR